MLHLAQEQDGYLTMGAMAEIATLLDLEPAEVRGTASFYDMFTFDPVGKYLIAVCTGLPCMIRGAYELLDEMNDALHRDPSKATVFTVKEWECVAMCGGAPCVAVNWRYFENMDPGRVHKLIDDLESGKLETTVPPHGTLRR